ncbi:LOW QUALITY PROTEIN: WD repeat-containing protein 55-like [Haliotis rubra]|uniref:LOW QUALITY PROTEIN: WD repeat-containing protein 55-like n=1 Tax=Haliotis rubra TaxID=36100 RepID=UPI001EE56376|nr:LOW QUALITY PROTEIN: WD repeat-containing protein 55-like [Haliotis rubra]
MADEDCEAPKQIELEDLTVTVDFHPSKDIIAVGCIDGEVSIHSYSTKESNKLLKKLCHHKNACRCIKFSPSGDRLHTVSKDKSLWSIDTETGKVKKKIKKAHEALTYSLVTTDENFIATGDDDGTIKVWDMRTKTCTYEVKENDDFISDMIIDDQRKFFLATSGDGTLSAFNIRRKRMDLQSELFDSEFLSLAAMKGEKKVVCGTGEGVLNVFNWGEWGNISDPVPGHPMSVDCMVPITRDVVCTGSIGGIIRAVNILPNRFVGVVGEHENFPVEGLCLSHDKTLLASCSHDQKVKFWNIEGLENIKFNERKKAKKSNKNKRLNSSKQDNFFSGLVDDDKKDNVGDSDTDDDDDDSDDEGEEEDSD